MVAVKERLFCYDQEKDIKSNLKDVKADKINYYLSNNIKSNDNNVTIKDKIDLLRGKIKEDSLQNYNKAIMNFWLQDNNNESFKSEPTSLRKKEEATQHIGNEYLDLIYNIYDRYLVQDKAEYKIRSLFNRKTNNILNKFPEGEHTISISNMRFERNNSMPDIKKYLDIKSSLYAAKISVKEVDNIPTPLLKDSNIRIGDILMDLSRYENKRDVIEKYNNLLGAEDINLALEYASKVFNAKDYETSLQERKSNIEKKIDLFKRYLWPVNEIGNFYGFDPLDENFFKKYNKWCMLKYKEPANSQNINVWRIEEYLSWAGYTPIRMASAKLGMKPKTLKSFIDKVLKNFMDIDNMYVSDSLVSSDFINNLSKYLFINVGQYDYQTYCSKIHNAINNSDVAVEPLICDTSLALNENPPKFASTYDDITGEPISEEYSILLNFEKPITLKPYMCSIKTYVKYKNILKQYLMGSEPNHILIKKIEELNAEDCK